MAEVAVGKRNVENPSPSDGYIDTDYNEANIECPFCRAKIKPRVRISVWGGNVQQTGTTGLYPTFSTTVRSDIVKVTIDHECSGPRKSPE